MALSLANTRKQGWINRLAAMGTFGTCGTTRRGPFMSVEEDRAANRRTLHLLLVTAWAVALVAVFVRFA